MADASCALESGCFSSITFSLRFRFSNALTIMKQTKAIIIKLMMATIRLPAGQELMVSACAAFKAGSRIFVVMRVTTELTIFPKAPAIITAIAKSTTLPLLMKV